MIDRQRSGRAGEGHRLCTRTIDLRAATFGNGHGGCSQASKLVPATANCSLLVMSAVVAPPGMTVEALIVPSKADLASEG